MSETTRTTVTQGVHHVGLTVPDLVQTRSFFVDVLGYTEVGELPEYPAAFVTDGSTMITIWQAKDPSTAVSFDRHNVIGLHHLALRVADHQSLAELHAGLLEDERVRIEFPPEPLSGTPLLHMMCSIPGGVRVEFIAVSG